MPLIHKTLWLVKEAVVVVVVGAGGGGGGGQNIIIIYCPAGHYIMTHGSLFRQVKI